MGLTIWLTAAALYALFLLWHENWRGKLTPAEIERYLAELDGSPGTDPEARAATRAFLEADDGKPFFMVNLVRIEPGAVPDPMTGTPTRGSALANRYFRQFQGVLLARGGYPALAARKVGPYLDSWNTPPDPGWTLMGWMRYRSRRDMLALAAHPRFKAAHPYKFAAMPVTFSFPSQPMVMLVAGPRLTVALVLIAAAALTQLAVRA